MSCESVLVPVAVVEGLVSGSSGHPRVKPEDEDDDLWGWGGYSPQALCYEDGKGGYPPLRRTLSRLGGFALRVDC